MQNDVEITINKKCQNPFRNIAGQKSPCTSSLLVWHMYIIKYCTYSFDVLKVSFLPTASMHVAFRNLLCKNHLLSDLIKSCEVKMRGVTLVRCNFRKNL